MESKYKSLFIASLLLLCIGQALAGTTLPAMRFVHGFLVGLALVCSVAGLVLYTLASKKN